MSENRFRKQPGEVLDYDIDYSDWLAAREDTVDSYTVSAATGVTLDSYAMTSGVIKVWLSGGTHNVTYKVEAEVTTVGGREKHAAIYVKVVEI